MSNFTQPDRRALDNYITGHYGEDQFPPHLTQEENTMTVNKLLSKVFARVLELADKKIDSLRAEYPEVTDTQGQLIQHCKDLGLSRGKLIEAILCEEFLLETDQEIQK